MCHIQLANLLVIPQRKAQNLNNPQNTSFPILCCLKGSVTSVMEFLQSWIKITVFNSVNFTLVCGLNRKSLVLLIEILLGKQNLGRSFQNEVFQKLELSEKKEVKAVLLLNIILKQKSFSEKIELKAPS
jgi:hypothetical protein